MPEAVYKTCKKCRENKPLEEFSRYGNDWIRGACRGCIRIANRRRNRAYAERHSQKLKTKRRKQRLENPERQALHQKKHREKHPTRYRARRKLAYALESGKLIKPDRCEDCGEQTASRDLHGHHEDYDKPLDVHWLCRGCHKRRHLIGTPGVDTSKSAISGLSGRTESS